MLCGFTENRGAFRWDAVPESGPFTSVKAIDSVRLAGSYLKVSSSKFDYAMQYTPDDDIAAGRVIRFATVDEMLSSLQSQDT